MNLQKKTAVITGGGTGIGQGIAKAFVAAGAKVAIGGRREDKLRDVASSVAGGETILTHVLDVAQRDSVAAFFHWAEKEFGSIDILINCAGMNIPNRLMAETRPEQWDQLLEVNATGAYNCMYAVLPQMRLRKDGLIVNVSSVSGIRASKLGGTAYSASKFAMAALGTAVALEEGVNGIRVTNVFPGEVDTPILDARPVKVSDEHRARILQPEDVAAAVLMIACLPPRAHVAELIIKPTTQDFA